MKNLSPCHVSEFLARDENKSSAVAEMGDRLATIDIGRKVEVCCALSLGGRSWAPSITMLRKPRPTSVPSGIFIHQPFGNNTSTLQTDRQDRQENGLVAYGEPLLVTVAQKLSDEQ